MLIKRMYLQSPSRKMFFCRGQYISIEQVLEEGQRRSDPFYCLCDCAIPVKLVKNMLSKLEKTGKTGWAFFDKAKVIIFRRIYYEKIV